MKDKIKRILEVHSEKLRTSSDEYEFVNIENFDEVAEEIVKLFAIPDVSNTEGKLQAVEELKDLAYEVCPEHRLDDLYGIIDRL